jgi:hypothetical protein
MDHMDNKNEMENNGHKCKTGCCNACCGCACHLGMKKGYYMRHFLVLIVGVLLAFWCGYKLGMMKGFILSEYGGPTPTYRWMMNNKLAQ